MAGSTAKSNIIQFGLFELDLQARELRKSGIRIKLQEQPFQILSMLLEHPGEIVTREELQKRLWPGDTFVDFDLSLNSAIKKLRQALNDDSENPRFIETLYRRGYRFIGSANGVARLEAVEPPNAILAQRTPTEPMPAVTVSVPASSPTRHGKLLLLFGTLALLASAAVFWFGRAQPPRVLGYTQITHDGLRKETTVTDGERLYFSELDGDHFVVAQVSVTGGETSVLAIPFKNVGLGDIAPDGSALLVSSFEDTSQESPLWSVPLPTGSPHRLNDSSRGATWSSDGSEIAFVNGSDLYAAKSNGSQPRKLATLSGPAWGLRFSPDGRRLRFDALDRRNGSSSLWEVNRDGSGLHPLLPGWNSTPHECCGNWTPDGKYYIFQSLRDGRNNLWALPAQTHWFRAHARPMQLTNGPLDFSFPVPSKDGKRIFTFGSQPRNELVRYDGRSGFASYLRGISATDLAFSLDGQWVAYVSVPEQTLWRSKVDGSERLQLTDSSMWAGLPRWSPDGKQIVFMGRTINTNWRAYLISGAGGAVRDLIPGTEAGFDPGWSPDGKSLVLTLNEAGTPESFPSGPGIAIVDLQTQKRSLIPGAAQLFSPRWSPNGKYIAAVTDDSQKLVLFDRATQRWAELVSMPIGYPSWSHDGQYLYFDTTLTDDPAFFRVRISDRKLERLVSRRACGGSGDNSHRGQV